mmetsp:Transcript_85325/g.182865  ORF Transcript_85325/g.182865 Transcript_85325/m.182865 type:complete len:259 (+) Transcript_85325:1023-1799(+)
MELVGKDLDHALEQILLRHDVLDPDHVLQNLGQSGLLIVLQSHPLQLAESHQVRAHQNPQVMSLLLPLVFVLCGALRLHPHPQSVALAEVVEDKVEGIVDVPTVALEFGANVRQLILHHLRKIVPQEQASERVLHAFAQLVDILQDLLGRSLLGLDVACGHCGQQVEPRQDVACMLHGLVEVHHLPTVSCLVAEESRQDLHLLKNAHVELVIIFRRQQGGAQLADEVRGILQSLPQVVVVDGPLHVEGLLLDHCGGLV